MDKTQQAAARAKLSAVGSQLVKARMWVSEGDLLKAFQAAEEAYMAAFDAKDYLNGLLDTVVKSVPSQRALDG